LLLAALTGCGDDHVHAVNDAPRKPMGEPQKHADAGRPRASDAGTDAGDSPIYDFVAAQAYHDFPSLELVGLQRAHKFEAFLDPRIEPSQVASVRVLGPDAFVFEFANEPFGDTLNGYIDNADVPALWYQALELDSLTDGRYTLEVTLNDGTHGFASRPAGRDPRVHHHHALTVVLGDELDPLEQRGAIELDDLHVVPDVSSARAAACAARSARAPARSARDSYRSVLPDHR
jgi:hypothetical protein